MLSEGLTPNLVTYNTLLEVYAKQAKWEQALSTLDALQRQVRPSASQHYPAPLPPAGAEQPSHSHAAGSVRLRQPV
jgi:pentatricopeptide repeat protein